MNVGSGSTSSSTSGGDSWFGSQSTILAKGGGSVSDNSNTRGTGGSASLGIGTVKFDGGTGAAGVGGSYGGGGGSSAGTSSAGNYTSNQTTRTGEQLLLEEDPEDWVHRVERLAKMVLLLAVAAAVDLEQDLTAHKILEMAPMVR